jgi:hypothetical protein
MKKMNESSDELLKYRWDENVEVQNINMQDKTVTLTNGFVFNHKKWYERFVNFWDARIVGKSIIPVFYEYLFARGGSHQYAQLVKGKQHEGFLLGQMGKPLLNAKKAIAVGTILALAIGGVIVVVIAKSQGLIPSW